MKATTIWKFTLPINDVVGVDMPIGAELLSVQADQAGQLDRLTAWAMVDSNAGIERRVFAMLGTGRPITAEIRKRDHVATVQHGQFVWHVFEVEVERCPVCKSSDRAIRGDGVKIESFGEEPRYLECVDPWHDGEEGS